jgi:hypothetical protein
VLLQVENLRGFRGCSSILCPISIWAHRTSIRIGPNSLVSKVIADAAIGDSMISRLKKRDSEKSHLGKGLSLWQTVVPSTGF